METTVIANFSTRRDAELAVEHLVQELQIDRADIFIQPSGPSNSAGSRIAGSDLHSGHPGIEKHGQPELNAPIELSVDFHGQDWKKLEAALKEAGASHVSRR
jgi:hypothetical protein